MATMVMQSHPLPLERAVGLVREYYGLDTRAARLTGERDENFRMSAADGREFVLKVAHPAENPGVSGLTTAALLHLESQDPTLPCPRVVRERGGHTRVRFVDERGIERTARLLTYLPGQPLISMAGLPGLPGACGRLGGRLTRALRTFAHPAAHRAIVWDVHHAGYLAGLVGEVPGFPCRREAIEVLERIVPRIAAHFPRLRQQVVHNDLNPRNILVAPGGEVSGIIDFGDMTYTAIIADVAVTAAELIPQNCAAGTGAAVESVREVANAYHESVPLLPRELDMLGTLVAARLVANTVVHEWHLHHNPAGDHYRPLDADFIRERLQIAAELAREASRL
jgi:hydroxylysine kinase